MVKIVKGLQKARIELKPLLDGFGEAVYCEWPGPLTIVGPLTASS